MKLAAVVVWTRKTIPHIASEVVGLMGLALISKGAALAWEPAGYIVPGILLVALAVFMKRVPKK